MLWDSTLTTVVSGAQPPAELDIHCASIGTASTTALARLLQHLDAACRQSSCYCAVLLCVTATSKSSGLKSGCSGTACQCVQQRPTSRKSLAQQQAQRHALLQSITLSIGTGDNFPQPQAQTHISSNLPPNTTNTKPPPRHLIRHPARHPQGGI